MNEKSIIAQELGRRGGLKTKELYGKSHFKALADKASAKRSQKSEKDEKSEKGG